MNVMRLRLRSVSTPFNEGSHVELKFDVKLDQEEGELYLRVRASDAPEYRVGDLYAAKLTKLP